jgi:hypothetical protein
MNALIKALTITRLRRYILNELRKLREGAIQASLKSLFPKIFYSIKTHRFCSKDGEHLTIFLKNRFFYQLFLLPFVCHRFLLEMIGFDFFPKTTGRS